MKQIVTKLVATVLCCTVFLTTTVSTAFSKQWFTGGTRWDDCMNAAYDDCDYAINKAYQTAQLELNNAGRTALAAGLVVGGFVGAEATKATKNWWGVAIGAFTGIVAAGVTYYNTSESALLKQSQAGNDALRQLDKSMKACDGA